MTSIPTPFQALRRTLLGHSDLPALRAGYLAVAALIASLLNLGIFGVIVAFGFILDYRRYKTSKIKPGLAMRAALRDNIFDLGLLSIALLASLSSSSGHAVILAGGIMRYQESIVRGFVLLAAKSTMLFRLLKRLEQGSTRFALSNVYRPLTVPELAAIGCLGIALLLPLSAFLLPSDLSNVDAALLKVFTPWRF